MNLRRILLAAGVCLLMVPAAIAAPSAKAKSVTDAQIEKWRDKTTNCMREYGATPYAVSKMKPVGPLYRRWVLVLWKARAEVWCKLLLDANRYPEQAIRMVFGKYADQALAVARCESGYSVYAQNGQYLGMFQMGSSERSLYGHGSTPLAQAKAAWRYFDRSGRDWSPWSCKPW